MVIQHSRISLRVNAKKCAKRLLSLWHIFMYQQLIVRR